MHNDGASTLWAKPDLADPHRLPDKSRRVRRMFDSIAPTYERVNSVFSAGCDARWRRTAVALAEVVADDTVLDVACGTGDFSRAFLAGRAGRPRQVIGCDFAHGMLLHARGVPGLAVGWCEADAQRLPFADSVFSVVSCAFGVRNFQDLDRGLGEMFRVLRRGGQSVILEFTRPTGRVVRALYEFYARRLMPIGAALVSGDRTGAYRYLPSSVVSFLDAAQMSARLRAAGFARVRCRPLTCGAVTVYLADKD